MPAAELWHPLTNRHFWAGSRQNQCDRNYRTVSVLRFPYGRKGETYVSERAAGCNWLRTLGFLRVLLQRFPLRHQVSDFPHQGLMTIDDLL